MNNPLLIVFTIFAVIDLIFVGMTTFFVVKLVKELLKEKSILEQVTDLFEKLKKSDRNFIEQG
jgi:hypothetical protein